jgi:hypothetical protein
MHSLRVENPCPSGRAFFGLEIPADLSDECFAIIRAQIEFRRRCMNQGFDNLLELLALHEKAVKIGTEKGKAAKEGAP